MVTTAPAPSLKDQIQQTVLDAITGKKRAGAGVSVGVGKTLIGLRDMDRILDGGRRTPTIPKPFLVVAPKTSIFESWKTEAMKFGLDYLLDYIEFSTYLSLPKRTDTYHKIYLDECHSLKDSHVPVLEAHQGAILGLTGTQPTYKKGEKGQLVQKYCPIVIDYTTDEAVNAGILNDYRIVVHGIPLSKKNDFVIKFKSGGQKTSSEYETYWYWTNRLLRAEGVLFDEVDESSPPEMLRIQRMQALMKFGSKETYLRRLSKESTEKTILFANTQEQADRLAEHSYYSGNKQNKANLAAFNEGTINRLACVQQLSEGINIANLRVGIIWHSFGNERKASQRIGRLLRLNPDQTATVHVLMYLDTVDEQWVASALEKFDANKIFHVQHTFS